MKIALWIVQGLLAFAFIGAGMMKVLTPYEALTAEMAWVAAVPSFVPKIVGLLEVAGGLGIILPAALKIKPKLTPLAAWGLVATMIGAALTHVVLGEFQMLGAPIVLGGLAAFVGWGRSKKFPVAERGASVPAAA